MSNTTRRITAAACAIAACATFAGCGSEGASGGSSEAFDPNAKTEITFGGWTLSATPEFQQLADAFMQKYPNVTVTLKGYQAGDDYDKQLTADLAGGTAPMVVPMKSPMTKYYTYADSGQLIDLSDIVSSFDGDDSISFQGMQKDGKYYAVPYRQDAYVLYYNKTMFEKAGVALPDGTWTWDDYIKVAEELKEKLPAAGYDPTVTYPTYTHYWQQFPQSVALAQTEGADYYSGDYSFMKPFYETFLKLQDEQLTINFNQAFASQVSYQNQFGTEKCAMYPIGTWAITGLINNQNNGDAEQFEWGIAPLPQTADNTSGELLTIGEVNGLAISSSAKGQQLAAAKEFVKFAIGVDGAKTLAAAGTTPAYINDDVTETFFSLKGVPTDDLSKKAWSGQKAVLSPVPGEHSGDIASALKTAHSAIMTGTKSIDQGLADAEKEIKNAIG